MDVTLAGAGIDVRCAPGTETLADAFLPGLTAGDTSDGQAAGDTSMGAPPLTLTVDLDASLLDRQVPADAVGSAHRRSGSEHLWVVPRPRHLQQLLPDAPDGPHARLVVDAAALADGTVRARPAVHAVATWAAGRGVMPLHAAAIARGDRAVILVGPGGRGKTTTALSLAGRGWRLIADDLCFLAATPAGPVVHGLYATAVLTPASAERLGAGSWRGLGRTHVGKLAVRLPDDLPVARSARLTTVVAVDHGVDDAYRLARLPHRTAHAVWQEALAPALQTHGPTPALLAAYARAVRTLPVLRLSLGWDVVRLDAILTGLVEGGAP